MYPKILGLRRLKNMGFPYPPYIIIDLNNDKITNVKEYVFQKLDAVKIPNMKNDRIGVTIRVSLPERPDKRGKHGGLHHTDKRKIFEIILQKHEEYMPKEKFIIQHTVDARCSGALMKEIREITIETIPGDAPPLFEGKTSNFERWIYISKWKKDKAYTLNESEYEILRKKELNILDKFHQRLIWDTYLEWSIAKNGQIYFYEYLKL